MMNLGRAVDMAGIQSPEKELRFTRAGQALGYWLSGVVGLSVVCFWVWLWWNGCDVYALKWLGLPLLWALLSFRVAVHMTRHAYVILTPIGVEIFPLIRPSEKMRCVMWSEIHEVEIDAAAKWVTLHCDRERRSGVYVSLAPIAKSQRTLLWAALQGRMEGLERES